MVWIIALLCLAVVGLAGYYRGPICAAFSLLGLFFGVVLCGPLSPLTQRLVPLLGFHHPMWQLFIPKVLAFLIVLIIFNIVGNVLHQKLTIYFKYQKDERLYFRWERLYQRLGFCLGLVNGTVYFFLLMMPVYVGGYFATEAGGADAPGGVRLLARLRSELHSSNLDKVLAAHDPTPPQVYQAADIIDVVLSNPILESRLAHYPPLLTLSQRKDLQDIANDVQLQQMIQSQAKISDLMANQKIQAITTNAAVIDDIRALVGQDLDDLQAYLNTGKSAKFDGEKILGIWAIDVRTTLTEDRKRNPNLSARQVAAARAALTPLITGLSLTITTDNQVFMKKQNPNTSEYTVVAQGTWKKSGETYEIALPTSTEVTLPPSDTPTLQFSRDGHVLIFNKEL